MGRIALVFALLLVPGLASADADGKKKKPPKPPPIPGIHWERDLDEGFRRAAQEGRPILLCLNALEDEGANIQLATQLYRSASWGTATRGYVAFVCNPNDHDGEDGLSTRYPGTPSSTVNAALRYVLKRFGNDLVSPQHFILEPDGDLAFRKAYYERVVGPALLETWLARVSPPVAYARANIDRESKIRALGSAPAESLGPDARKWLESSDGFAAVGILSALDEEFDAGRRLVLIESLAHASPHQAAVLGYGADERVDYPEDEPAETIAWLGALFAVDRETAVVAASRALARTTDKAGRDAILRVWAGGPIDAIETAIPAKEQSLAVEALLLAGDARAAKIEPPETSEAMWMRIQRARLASGVDERLWDPLETALADPRVAAKYGALLEADADEVRTNIAEVVELLRKSKLERLRIAAALALLRTLSPDDADDVATTLTAAVFDAIEGPETRRSAVSRLGIDPGELPEDWMAALQAHMRGDR